MKKTKNLNTYKKIVHQLMEICMRFGKNVTKIDIRLFQRRKSWKGLTIIFLLNVSSLLMRGWWYVRGFYCLFYFSCLTWRFNSRFRSYMISTACFLKLRTCWRTIGYSRVEKSYTLLKLREKIQLQHWLMQKLLS